MHPSKWVRGRGGFNCKHGCCHRGPLARAKRGAARAERRAGRRAVRGYYDTTED